MNVRARLRDRGEWRQLVRDHRVTSLIILLFTRVISQLTAVKRAWTTDLHFIAWQKQLHPLHDT